VDTGTANRFVADLVVGLCTGLMVAVVEVVLKNAWLAVAGGQREGAQLIFGPVAFRPEREPAQARR
jgi:hypothetical protein